MFDPLWKIFSLHECYQRHVHLRMMLVWLFLRSSERFLIDGDALAVYAFENPLVDWAHQGQILHVVYIMEKILVDMAQVGVCLWALVHDNVCKGPFMCLCMRIRGESTQIIQWVIARTNSTIRKRVPWHTLTEPKTYSKTNTIYDTSTCSSYRLATWLRDARHCLACVWELIHTHGPKQAKQLQTAHYSEIFDIISQSKTPKQRVHNINTHSHTWSFIVRAYEKLLAWITNKETK